MRPYRLYSVCSTLPSGVERGYYCAFISSTQRFNKFKSVLNKINPVVNKFYLVLSASQLVLSSSIQFSDSSIRYKNVYIAFLIHSGRIHNPFLSWLQLYPLSCFMSHVTFTNSHKQNAPRLCVDYLYISRTYCELGSRKMCTNNCTLPLTAQRCIYVRRRIEVRWFRSYYVVTHSEYRTCPPTENFEQARRSLEPTRSRKFM